MQSKSLFTVGIITLVIFGLIYYLVRSSSESKIQETSQEEISVQRESELESEENMQDLKQYNNPPEMQLKEGVNYKAIISTNKGAISIDLFETEVPVTVNNFVFLAREGFYDGVAFHRILKEFMSQAGDPLGTGAGGPGYRFDDEEFDGQYSKGTLAMANAGPNTNGSQFFIMNVDYDLQPAYTIFGRADESSFAVIDDIAATPVTFNSRGEKSVPTEEVVIESIEIIEE